MAKAALQLRLLGELQVICNGQALTLPPSKKTRALLAYLAMQAKAFRREHLCELLWEIPDDPRGSLRWSLSKIRRLVDQKNRARIVADRLTVSFDTSDVAIDVLDLHEKVRHGLESLETATLEKLANQYRGVFLEGLELPNFQDFYLWCVSEQELAAKSQASVLRELIPRLAPLDGLAHARSLVSIAPYDEYARVVLIRLLVGLGRDQEAEQQYRIAKRQLAEVGAKDFSALTRAWKGEIDVKAEVGKPVTRPASNHQNGFVTNELCGRSAEVASFDLLVDQVAQTGKAGMLLLRGEPGIGKSTLLQAFVQRLQAKQFFLLQASAFESETIRPFALWNDAFRRSKDLVLPDCLSGDGRIARDELFAGLSEFIETQAGDNAVAIMFDDVQWIDESSAAALHYVLRMCVHLPVLVVVAARDSELHDNSGMMQSLRGVRNEQLLEEMKLGPLSEQALAALIGQRAPEADARRLSLECGGNPLWAIELARADKEGNRGGSLSELVLERLSRMDADTKEVLHWAAVISPNLDITSLQRVTDLDVGQLQHAIELAEMQGMLHTSERGIAFTHHLIAMSIYNQISPARRQIMHRRVAEKLEEDTAIDLQHASDLAHHASKSGDFSLAARAMVLAGRLCLRFFANEDALSLACRGLQFADSLPDSEKVCLTLELSEVQLSAAPISDHQATADCFVELAEQALDHGALPHARLGYQMAAYVRWINGQWSDAQHDSLQGERVTRSADDQEHIVGMAEAAKCLALLERDLSRADAMLMEARSLAQRKSIRVPAIQTALGILRYYENQPDKARELLEEARTSFKSNGDRINEYLANEYLAMLAIENCEYEKAQRHCCQLLQIGEKLPEGSEAPFAQALNALCHYALQKQDQLDAPLSALRRVDAKHRLAYTLTRAAAIDLDMGSTDRAIVRAQEALDYSVLLKRPSEEMLAHVVLAQAYLIKDDAEQQVVHRRAVQALDKGTVANWARDRAQAILALS